MRISRKCASVVVAALLVCGLIAWPAPAASQQSAVSPPPVMVLAQKDKTPPANPAAQSAGASDQAVAQGTQGKKSDLPPGPPPGLPSGPPLDPPGPPPEKPPVSPHR
jgi:hypothetical protein